MKIGIISEFNTNTVNYGNNLQAYALNTYIKIIHPEYVVDTFYIKDSKILRVSYLGILARRTYRFVKRILGKEKRHILDLELFQKRLNSFEKFRKNISLSWKVMDWNSIQESDYDLFVVGSDVVWGQDVFAINRIKFLDFENRGRARKISYAASFGRNWIPMRNRRYLRRYLQDFWMVSVREKMSVELLKKIGIDNVLHTLDPTLLLKAEEWEHHEKKPYLDALEKKYVEGELIFEPFVFVYLLGTDVGQRKEISRLCQHHNLKIITVPYANGIRDIADDGFGDMQLMDCSPEEWIWLVHHAEYVITDSFHGIVFSTLFRKKFLAVTRHSNYKINDRLVDYLDTIGQRDKMVDLKQISCLNTLEWNYVEISRLLDEKIVFSCDYLKKACRGSVE